MATATGGAASTGGADPCSGDHLVCDDWGCTSADASLIEGACYSRCTPAPGAVGEPDSECTDPDRPYCGQVGDSFGGDYNCNGCHHICVAEPGINACGNDANACQ
jgi:hypothetical protein